MKPSEFKISISVESYDENTAENDRNCYVVEKRIVPKLSMFQTRVKKSPCKHTFTNKIMILEYKI